jgi:hypothetical protein
MSSTFIGCTACNTLLILTTDTDGPKRALAAGWRSVEAGWECPRHTPLPVPTEGENEPQAAETSPVTVGSD